MIFLMPIIKQSDPLGRHSLRKNPTANRFFDDTAGYIATGHHTKKRKLEQDEASSVPPVGEDFIASLAHNKKNKIAYEPQVNSIHGRFADFEREYIEIRPLAILQDKRNPYSWAVYAKKDMEGPLRIAEYHLTRKKVPKTGSKEEKALRDSAYYNTFQYRKNIALVPPEGKVSWPEKINCASCDETANFNMTRSIDHVYIEIPAGVKIKAGQQCLSFYGQDFFSNTEAAFQARVFINASDNEEESSDKLHKYPYKRITINLDSTLLALMNIVPSVMFSEPNLVKLNPNTVNLPLLAYNKQQVLPQHKQENMVLLHLACWRGDETMRDALLAKDANPNQQTKKFGFSALHFIMMSPHYANAAKKIAWLTRLKQAGATFMVQDHDENSILHHAITSGQLELLTALIALEPKMLTLLNTDDYDFFLQALAIGSIEALQALRPYMTTKYLNAYLPEDEDEEEDEEEGEQDFEYLTSVFDDLRDIVHPDQFKQIKDFMMSVCLEKNQELHAHLQQHFKNPELTDDSRCTIF
jgi:hypothetical protein